MTDTDFQYTYTPLEKPVRITEQDWPEGTVPLVSISCITYNHVNFIRDAIEGFLMQETTFPVEILIHDDASTDGTSDIVREYEAKYPQLIKVIYQTENQYSKGVQVGLINLDFASGNFIALCHCDDYWIRVDKLMDQVGFMEEKGLGISGHPAMVINGKGENLKYLTGHIVQKPSVYGADKLLWQSGNMMPYPSIMINHLVKEDMIKFMPPVRFHTGIQILGARRAGLGVLPLAYSAYRVNVSGSTTELILGDARKQKITAIERLSSIDFLRSIYGNRYRLSFAYITAKQYQIIYSGKNMQMVWRSMVGNGKALDRFLRLYFLMVFRISSILKKLMMASSQKG